MALTSHHNVPLDQLTTLGIGGPARVVAEIGGEEDARDALQAARAEGAPWCILGGGSNVIAPDADASGFGVNGWVLHPVDTTLEMVKRDREHTWLRAGAGVPWDDLVGTVTDARLAGITCLSGIPGKVGAAPIQNIGAYGQELASVFECADILDTADGSVRTWTAEDCGFSYRDSRLKRAAGRYLVLRVTLKLRTGGHAEVRYPELRRRLGMDAGSISPNLKTVRQAVLSIRRRKGMVCDARDPNSKSAGSFFMNPIVGQAEADAVFSRLQAGFAGDLQMPRYPVGDPLSGQCKLSAAWLIDRSGMSPAYVAPEHGGGRVSLSSKHTLALINRGGASAADLLAFAAHVQARVADATGIHLQREPVLLTPTVG